MEMAGNTVMRTFWQDQRYGSRILPKSPGFTLPAVVVLSLGLGTNTTVFTLLNAVLVWMPAAG